jgi:hypothetical protein
MSETVKVQPKLVTIRTYVDSVVRHITTILLYIKNNTQNNTVTFITINTATGIGKTKQRNITISGNTKFDIVELDSDEVSADVVSKIFTNGYFETSEYCNYRIDKQEEIKTTSLMQDKPAFESIPVSEGASTNRRIKTKTSTSNPVAKIAADSSGGNSALEDVKRKANAVMNAVRNPRMAYSIDESVVENEAFDPDIQQAEIDEGGNA